MVINTAQECVLNQSHSSSGEFRLWYDGPIRVDGALIQARKIALTGTSMHMTDGKLSATGCVALSIWNGNVTLSGSAEVTAASISVKARDLALVDQAKMLATGRGAARSESDA